MEKRILSFLLAFLMIAFMSPVPTFAEYKNDTALFGSEGLSKEPSELPHSLCGICLIDDCGIDHTSIISNDIKQTPDNAPIPDINKSSSQLRESEYIPDVSIVTDPESGIIVHADSIPGDATLSVENADVSDQLSSFDMSKDDLVFGLDIKLLTSDNTEYQPDDGIVLEIPVDAPVGTNIGILHTHDGNTTYIGMTQVLASGNIKFFAEGFSEFAGFTVDFHYNDTEYSIAGLSTISLSELFASLEIERKAENAVLVEFSDPSLIRVSKTENDWLLESLSAFQTGETLTVTFASGEIIVINVTDDYQEAIFGGAGSTRSATRPANSAKFILYDASAPKTGEVQVGSSSTAQVYSLSSANTTLGMIGQTHYWYYVYCSNKGSLDSTEAWMYVNERNTNNCAIRGSSLYDDTFYIDRISTAVIDSDPVNIIQEDYLSTEYEKRTVKIMINGQERKDLERTVNFPVNVYFTAEETRTQILVSAKDGYRYKNHTYDDASNTYTVNLVTLHTVTWKNFDNTTLETDTNAEYGSSPVYNGAEPKGPNADGYLSSFAGWSPTVSAVTADIVYTAQHNKTPVSYSVSFNGSGHTSGSMNDQRFTFDSPQELYKNAYKREYTVSYNTDGGDAIGPETVFSTFNGWEDRGSIVYKSTEYSYKTFDAPFYANPNKSEDVFTHPSYGSGHFNKYGLLDHFVNHGKAEYESGSEQRKPTPAGTEGPGLYPDGAKVSNLSAANGYTVPLYANWTLKSIILPTPNKEGHIFSGWSDGSKTYPEGASYTPTKNVTLTAQWTPMTYTVIWKNYDGSVLETDENVPYGTIPTYNCGLPTKPPTQEYTYVFSGWSPEVKEVTGEAAYTAVYTEEKNRYTLKGMIANGTVSNPVTTEYGSPAELTFTAAAGYRMTQWIGSDGSSGVIDDINQTKWVYTTSSLTSDIEITVTAVPIEYTITYYLNGGELSAGAVNPTTYTVETETFTLNNPKRDAYNFKGWAESPDAAYGVTSITISKGTVGNKTYYALWEHALLDLTIRTQSCDPNQSFIFTVSGTPLDKSCGTISLDVVLIGTDSITIRDLPLGIYTISEKDGWSWRESEIGTKTVDLTTKSQTVDFDFEITDRIYWLSDHSYKLRNGGS